MPNTVRKHKPCTKCGHYPKLKEFFSMLGVSFYLATGKCELCREASK